MKAQTGLGGREVSRSTDTINFNRLKPLQLSLRALSVSSSQGNAQPAVALQKGMLPDSLSESDMTTMDDNMSNIGVSNKQS